MIRLFLDTNIVIDMLQRREPFFLAAANIFALSVSGNAELYVSPMTYATASYLIGKRDIKKVKPLLSELRKFSHVTPTDETTIDKALLSDFEDFEDAMQYFSAFGLSMDYIITRNKKDFIASKVPVLTPEEFLQKQHN